MKKAYSVIVLLIIVTLLTACGSNEHNSLLESEEIKDSTTVIAVDEENKKYDDSTKKTEPDYEEQIAEAAKDYLDAFAKYDAREVYRFVSSDLEITVMSLDDIMSMFSMVNEEERKFERKFLFDICEELLSTSSTSIDSIVTDEQNGTAKVEFTVNRPDIIKVFEMLYSEPYKQLTDQEIKTAINQTNLEKQILVGELTLKTEDSKWLVSGMTTERQ